ncbi:hypothetical protein NPIL_444421 [Nephila pilipes]|uniref:Uncharacterized protein n=1 Tax=Nephila pilipes TaxID=299642 RepID=A0A8X6MKH5_NEPPI|nr:hypothetical protein NPIL_444421 [Nephila pilipes]
MCLIPSCHNFNQSQDSGFKASSFPKRPQTSTSTSSMPSEASVVDYHDNQLIRPETILLEISDDLAEHSIPVAPKWLPISVAIFPLSGMASLRQRTTLFHHEKNALPLLFGKFDSNSSSYLDRLRLRLGEENSELKGIQYLRMK